MFPVVVPLFLGLVAFLFAWHVLNIQRARSKLPPGPAPLPVIGNLGLLDFQLHPETLLKANVMLEYDIDEAQALLEKNLSTATRNLESLEEDLDFLRDQFTTTEVNMARVYNWDVKRRNKDDPSKSKA